mmetsp:Transcript_24742/g.58892  ORF Transcript_24742/g.58892 Transcript_24742/m.58892 type:complete len:174 (-) Transcript_24742:14-535(-)
MGGGHIAKGEPWSEQTGSTGRGCKSGKTRGVDRGCDWRGVGIAGGVGRAEAELWEGTDGSVGGRMEPMGGADGAPGHWGISRGSRKGKAGEDSGEGEAAYLEVLLLRHLALERDRALPRRERGRVSCAGEAGREGRVDAGVGCGAPSVGERGIERCFRGVCQGAVEMPHGGEA